MDPPPVAAVPLAPWVRIRNWLVDWRVVISTVLFTVLITRDVIQERRPHSWFGGDPAGPVGLALVLVGLFVRSWSAGVLRKGKELAVAGPYSLCRHPLYLGSALLMFGFCLLLGDGRNWLYICGPVAALYWLTIGKEEEKIARQYREPWPSYASRVPRLLPWRPDLYVHTGWSYAEWFGNREYQAVAGVTAGLVLIQLASHR